MSFTHLHLLSQTYYMWGLVPTLKKLITSRKIDRTTINMHVISARKRLGPMGAQVRAHNP